MSVTIHDVASKAGVSTTTVSLVLNGRPCRIAASTKARVEAAALELGFHRSPFKRMVGILLPDINNLFFSSIGSAFLRKTQELGGDGAVMVHGDKPGQDLVTLSTLIDRGVCGIVMVRSAHSSQEEENALRERILKSRIPVVLMDRKMDIPNVHSVLLDNHEGARMAVQYLLQKGHRRIGCITGPVGDVVSEERLRGYQDALRDAGVDFDDSLICRGNYRMEDGSKYLPYLLGKSVTSIFCFNDMMALGVCKGCRDYHLCVPGDISVIGFDGIPFCETLDIPLSTVEQPAEEMGKAAAILLHQMVEGSANVQDQVFYPTLQIRASSSVPHTAVEPEVPLSGTPAVHF